MKVIAEPNHAPIKLWTQGVELEEAAYKQLLNVASLPFIHKHIAVMPDVHWGMGCTVGSVVPTIGAIIPACVGVDIGCGVMACQTTLTANDLPDSLAALRSAIEQAVPHGRTDNGGSADVGKHSHASIPLSVRVAYAGLDSSLAEIINKHPKLETASKTAPFHMGTLGTGNHFIEICLDEEQRVWIMLHSGSRGIGNKIGSYFIEKAKEEMRRWFINVPDANLAYLPQGSVYFDDYVQALNWAQKFALKNRQVMMHLTIQALEMVLKRSVPVVAEAINCHHNYVAQEKHYGKNVWVTRKGAVRARQGDLGIIPGSMGAKSFIVRGKGEAASFMSCSHGAGRKMSRTAASQLFTLEDHAKATSGVECRKDIDVIDETPGAYKDIDAVMKAQEDLVEVVHTLRQVVCVKG